MKRGFGYLVCDEKKPPPFVKNTFPFIHNTKSCNSISMDVFDTFVLLMLCFCLLASFYAYLLYAAYVIAYQVRNLRE
jgi:hypothetical protein